MSEQPSDRTETGPSSQWQGPLAQARRVLVTGGAGFVGRHLVRLLVERGYEVRVLDDFSGGAEADFDHGDFRSQIDVRRGSILDNGALTEALRGADLLFHLAAVVGVDRVLEDPLRALQVNGNGTAMVLQAAAREGIPVVYTSSSEVYGTRPQPPSRETDAIVAGSTDDPRGGYACAKALGEWWAQAYGQQHGLPVLTLRLFNTVGPGQSGSGGMVLPRLIDAALDGRALTVHGDGRQTRCFADVREVVRAICDLASSADAYGRVFNVGAATEISILDLANTVLQTVGGSSEILHTKSPRPSDPRRRLPCLDRLAGEIGWVPHTGIDQLVRDVVADRTAARTADSSRTRV